MCCEYFHPSVFCYFSTTDAMFIRECSTFRLVALVYHALFQNFLSMLSRTSRSLHCKLPGKKIFKSAKARVGTHFSSSRSAPCARREMNRWSYTRCGKPEYHTRFKPALVTRIKVSSSSPRVSPIASDPDAPAVHHDFCRLNRGTARLEGR
jgi:hypothetical protein